MSILKKSLKRLMMTILFIAALLTTFQSLSGVKAKSMNEITNKLEKMSFDGTEGTYITNHYRSLGVVLKALNRAGKAETHISSSEQVSGVKPKLEDRDWSKYPAATVVATGYTAGYESTGKNPGHPEFGITYSGVKVKRDLYSTVAADLNVFPIGTILFIPGYGFGVVADKGGAIKGNRLDLYYDTVKDVYEEWGKKQVQVYVIERGNGKLTEQKLKQLNENKSMQVFRQQYTKKKNKQKY